MEKVAGGRWPWPVTT